MRKNCFDWINRKKPKSCRQNDSYKRRKNMEYKFEEIKLQRTLKDVEKNSKRYNKKQTKIIPGKK